MTPKIVSYFEDIVPGKCPGVVDLDAKASHHLVNRSGETLQSIIQSVKRVSEIVGDIAIASREQSTGIEQVNLAMGQMDGVTQTNSAQTKDLAGEPEQAVHGPFPGGHHMATDGPGPTWCISGQHLR